MIPFNNSMPQHMLLAKPLEGVIHSEVERGWFFLDQEEEAFEGSFAAFHALVNVVGVDYVMQVITDRDRGD